MAAAVKRQSVKITHRITRRMSEIRITDIICDTQKWTESEARLRARCHSRYGATQGKLLGQIAFEVLNVLVFSALCVLFLYNHSFEYKLNNQTEQNELQTALATFTLHNIS